MISYDPYEFQQKNRDYLSTQLTEHTLVPHSNDSAHRNYHMHTVYIRG